MVGAGSLLREGPAMASSLLLHPLRHIAAASSSSSSSFSDSSSSSPASGILSKVRHRSQFSRFSESARHAPQSFPMKRGVCSPPRSDRTGTAVSMHRYSSPDCLMCSWKGSQRYGMRSCFCTSAAGNLNPYPSQNPNPNYGQSPSPPQPPASNPNPTQPQAANPNPNLNPSSNPNPRQTWQQQSPPPRMQGYGSNPAAGNNNFSPPSGPGANTNHPNNNLRPPSSANTSNPPRTSAAAEVIDKYLGPSDLKLEKPSNNNNNNNNYNSNTSSRRNFSPGGQEKKSGKDLVAESAACAVIEKYLGPWPGFPPRDPKIDEYLDSLPENAACAAIDKYFGPYKPLFVFKKNEDNANSGGNSPPPPNRGPLRSRMMNRSRNRTWNPQDQGGGRSWTPPEGSASSPTPSPSPSPSPPSPQSQGPATMNPQASGTTPPPGPGGNGHPQQSS